MSTGARVRLYADGVRVADGGPGDDPSDPTALDGLAVVWGRGNAVDQPEASTCTFRLADPPGGGTFADTFHVGTAVRVTATLTTYPDPSISTFRDPGFEAGPPNATAQLNAAASRSTTRAHAGAAAALVTRLEPGRGWSLVLAPAPFAANGQSPAAWDDVPAAAAGQTWRWSVWALAPLGVVLTVAPVAFSAPWAAAWAPIPGAAPASLTGDGTWRQLAGTLTDAPAGAWIGLQAGAGPGRTWDGAAGTWDGAAGTWADLASVYLDDVAVLAPAAGVDADVLVFAGRITDLKMAYDPAIPAPVVDVVAADFTADLDNRDVGDAPWLLEAMAPRFNRILAAAGVPGITATIDPRPGALAVSWRDVDRQPAGGLLADLATSTDAVMWPAVHMVTGPYLRVEDVDNRPSLSGLELVGGVIVITASGGLDLTACDLLLEPAEWEQAVGDVSTRAAVGWREQTTDPDTLGPATIDRTATVIDGAREDPAAPYGTRRYGISTELTTDADATDVATRILARTGAGWRASGLTIDDGIPTAADPAHSALVVRSLLDGTARTGLALSLSDMPAWAPGPSTGVYLEGGTYTFTDGHWLLALVVSAAKGLGHSAGWNELDPAWTWNQLDPAMTWDDLYGVGP